MADDPSQRRPPVVRVDITLRSGGSRAVCDVVRAVGGRVISADGDHVVADVPGGAMGSLAVAPDVLRVDSGEPWDAPGRQAPDAPPEVRGRRVEAAEAEAGAEQSGSTRPDDVQKG